MNEKVSKDLVDYCKDVIYPRVKFWDKINGLFLYVAAFSVVTGFGIFVIMRPSGGGAEVNFSPFYLGFIVGMVILFLRSIPMAIRDRYRNAKETLDKVNKLKKRLEDLSRTRSKIAQAIKYEKEVLFLSISTDLSEN